MVSRTVLACLAVLASISAIQGTVVASKEYGHVVACSSLISESFKLNVDFKGYFGSLLQWKFDVMSGFFGYMASLFKGGRKTTYNIPQDKVPYVPYPDKWSNYLQVNIKLTQMYDLACQKKFGSLYEKGLILEVYRYMAYIFCLKLGYNIDSYPYLRSAQKIEVLRPKVNRCIKNLKAHYSSGPMADIVATLSVYLNIVNNSQCNSVADFDVNLFATCNEYCANVMLTISYHAGYNNINDAKVAYDNAYKIAIQDARATKVKKTINTRGDFKTPPCGCMNSD